MFTPEIFTKIINFYLPEPHASLLNGILFGVDLKTSRYFYQQLKTVGLLHIVVLSGMNITLLGAIIAQITQFFSKQVSVLITILIIIIFILFVGPKAPIVRAGIMGTLTLVAILLQQKTYPLFSLILSLIFIAIFRPNWLTTVSLQLSFGASLGIILFYRPPKLSSNTVFHKIIREIIDQLRVSLSAQIFTAPIIFFYFKQISLISPVSNILVAPLIGPLMIFGFLTAVLGKIHYWLGLPTAYICYAILDYFVTIINALAQPAWALIQFNR